MSKLKSRIEKLERRSGDGGGKGRILLVDCLIERSREDQLRDQGVDPESLRPNDIVVNVVC
jgi:hypothetical protein